MKLGCFGYESQISLIKNAGYDSAELDIGEIANMTEEEYKEFRNKALDSGLGLEVFSGLIPLTERIYSDTFDMQYWLDYTKRVSERIKPLGATMVPFGAGKCRSIPDNCEDDSLVKNKVMIFVRNICDIFDEYNIKLVIEPLGRAYSNYVNTLSDAVEFIKLVNHKNCNIMCDLRHMHSLNESMDEIIKYKEYILHAHIDYPKGSHRYFPNKEDGFDYKPYLQALKQSGYKGLLTLEATSYDDFALESRESAEYLNILLYNEM